MDREQRSAGQWLGANVRQRREALGLSQNDVAAAMAAAGHRWHQVTVYRVESGTRTVEVHEGYALARVLGTDLRSLVSGPSEARRIALLLDAHTALTNAGANVAVEVEAMERARQQLGDALAAHALPEGAAVSEADALLADLLDLTRSLLEGETVASRVDEGLRAAAQPQPRPASGQG